MEVYFLIISFIILTIAIVLFLKRPRASAVFADVEINRLKQENEHLKIDFARAEERANLFFVEKTQILKATQEERLRLEANLALLNKELSAEKIGLVKAEEIFKSQQQRLAEQQTYILDLQQKFKTEFENIANKLLEEKSEKFTVQNKVQMDVILNPFKEKLKSFEDKVDQVYKIEADERNILKGVISQLMELNKQISDEARNLSRALKGDHKKQGNWGEMILERVLERSGLTKNQEYRLQASISTLDGLRFQPDVIIDLPDNKHLVVDAKVSLVAYERLINAVTDEEREIYGKQHLLSIKNHVAELASKNYQELHQITSPDFVLLFVPIESSFSIAVQLDAELFNFAWDKRVVIVSPSTLLATLRTIASIWKQERQNRNVLEIARLSGEMYDKFVGFVSDLEGIGKNIKQSQETYEKALNKLSDGRGNLTITAEKIKKLGAKTNKQLDEKYIRDAN
ncbi:MAG: DNA recombination protein RmuC [Sphingobacteriaceae bacterium]